MNKKSILTVVVSLILCVVIVLALPTEISVEVNGDLSAIGVA